MSLKAECLTLLKSQERFSVSELERFLANGVDPNTPNLAHHLIDRATGKAVGAACLQLFFDYGYKYDPNRGNYGDLYYIARRGDQPLARVFFDNGYRAQDIFTSSVLGVSPECFWVYDTENAFVTHLVVVIGDMDAPLFELETPALSVVLFEPYPGEDEIEIGIITKKKKNPGKSTGNNGAGAVAATLIILFIFFAVIVGGVAVVLIVVWQRSQKEKKRKTMEMMVSAVVGANEVEMEMEEVKRKMEDKETEQILEKEQLKKQLESLKAEHDKLKRSSSFAGSLKDVGHVILWEDVGVDDGMPVIWKKEVALLDDEDCYSELKTGEWKKGKSKVGVKVLLRVFQPKIFEKLKVIDVQAVLGREVSEYARIRAPNVATVYGYTTLDDKRGLAVVSEWFEHGDGQQYLVEMREKKFVFNQKIRVMFEVAWGMSKILSFFEKTHKALNWTSVQFTKDVKPKIVMQCVETFKGKHEDDKYSAPELTKPEILKGDSDDESDEESDSETSYEESVEGKADVFSFGIMMFELLTLEFDWAKDEKGVGLKIANDENFRPEFVENAEQFLPNWYINLMNKCWDSNPRVRPSFEKIRMIVNAILESQDDDDDDDDDEGEGDE